MCNVLARCHRRGYDYTSGVYGLEDAREMYTARHFLDQNGRQTFGSEFLVYAEIIDFAHRNDTDTRSAGG